MKVTYISFNGGAIIRPYDAEREQFASMQVFIKRGGVWGVSRHYKNVTLSSACRLFSVIRCIQDDLNSRVDEIPF